MVEAVNPDGGSAAVFMALARQTAEAQNSAQQARNTQEQQSHATVFNQELLNHAQPANSVVTTTTTAAEPTPASTVTSDKFAPDSRTGQDAGKFEIRVENMQFPPAVAVLVASLSPEYRLSVPLKFGDRLDKTFDSVDTATAYARSVGENGAAVVAEGDHYAVYKLQGTGLWQPDFDIKSVASDGLLIKNDVFGTEGVKTMVTKDGYVVDLTNGQSHVELSGASYDPFSAHKNALGEGLAGLHGDRAQFEKHFERVMRDAAFTALDQSETAAQTALEGLSTDASLEKPAEQFSDTDRAAIDKAKTQMAPIDEKIIAKKQELDAARKELEQAEGQLRAGVGLYNSLFGPQRTLSPGEAWDRAEKAKTTVHRIEAELNGLNAARVQAAQDYPLLLRVEPEKTREFNAKSESDQVKFLHKEAKDVLSDIKTTRANLKNGKFNLWTMPDLRNTTAAGLGINGEQLKWIEGRAQQEQNTETAWKLGEATLAIGFAVGGAFVTGGTSLLLLGASAAIGIHGAVDTTQEYFRNNAATNTNLDPSAGLLPPDMKQHWGWVAAAWIGVGLDVGMVTSTVRALRAGKISMEAAAKSLGTDAKTLRAMLDTAKASKLEVKTLDAAEFTAKYGDDVQAVTLLREGKDGRLTVEIVSNKALSASERSKALAEEFAHLKQLNDPAIREKMLKLTEKRLAGWKAMSASDKRDLIHTKLEVEADAQKILLKEGGPNVDKAMAQEHLTNIEAKLGELDEAAKSGRVPKWVEHADAPRLFSKVGASDASKLFERVEQRVSSMERFSLTYTKDEVNQIVKKGRALGLTDRQIEDFIVVGSRDAKPISSDSLLKQMDNYQSVLKRGYPYRFDSLEQFNAFKKDVLDAVERAGLPKDKVVLQGSALRKTDADDLDLAILLDDHSFMSKIVDTFGGYVKLAKGNAIDISRMSEAELHKLADNILSDKTHTVYNATARTFALAVKSGKMRSNEIEALNIGAKKISRTFNSKTSITVMAERSQFNLEPFIELSK